MMRTSLPSVAAMTILRQTWCCEMLFQNRAGSSNLRPVMLGPLLMCHNKGEPATHMLCDEIVWACHGLTEHFKVVGADGEKSIHNQCLIYFSKALLLLCFKHQRDNVSDYVKKNLAISMTQREGLLDEIFGSSIIEGIIDAESIDECELLQ